MKLVKPVENKDNCTSVLKSELSCIRCYPGIHMKEILDVLFVHVIRGYMIFFTAILEMFALGM